MTTARTRRRGNADGGLTSLFNARSVSPAVVSGMARNGSEPFRLLPCNRIRHETREGSEPAEMRREATYTTRAVSRRLLAA